MILFADLLAEASLAVLSRMWRTALIVFAVGAGTFAVSATSVSSLGAETAVLASLDPDELVRIIVTPTDPQASIPWDSVERVEALAGVESAGYLAEAISGRIAVRTPEGKTLTALTAPVLAATSGVFGATSSTFTSGRAFDVGHEARADQVAVVGSRLAKRLGVSLENGTMISIRGAKHTLVGVLSASDDPSLVDAIVVPWSTLRLSPGTLSVASVRVLALSKNQQQLLRSIPFTIDPVEHGAFRIASTAEQASKRSEILDTLFRLRLLLALIGLGVTLLVVASASMLSVKERRTEIGVRRAIGASRVDVAIQLVAESVATGTAGAFLGSMLGLLVAQRLAVANGWSFVVDSQLLLLTVLTGSLASIAASTYPAVRAASIQPVEALRSI